MIAAAWWFISGTGNSIKPKWFLVGLVGLLLALLTGCSDNVRPTAVSAGVPSAPPTPANYNGVPDAATAGPVSRPLPGPDRSYFRFPKRPAHPYPTVHR